MKRITALLLIIAVCFTFASCGKKDADSTTNTAATVTTAETTTEKAKEPLDEEKAAYLYNKAYTVAKVWFAFYNDHWDKSDSFRDESGYEYFAVNHESIDSLAALKKYLCGYFSESFVDEMLGKVYLEKDGKLYQVCCVAGDAMPVRKLDLTKAELVSESEDRMTYNVTVSSYYELLLYEGEDPLRRNIDRVDYVYENGRWVVDNHFTHGLYPDYEWNA